MIAMRLPCDCVWATLQVEEDSRDSNGRPSPEKRLSRRSSMKTTLQLQTHAHPEGLWEDGDPLWHQLLYCPGDKITLWCTSSEVPSLRRLTGVRLQLTNCYLLIAACYLLLTMRYLLRTAYYPLLTLGPLLSATYYLLATCYLILTPYFLLHARYSLLTIHCLLLTTYY